MNTTTSTTTGSDTAAATTPQPMICLAWRPECASASSAMSGMCTGFPDPSSDDCMIKVTQEQPIYQHQMDVGGEMMVCAMVGEQLYGVGDATRGMCTVNMMQNSQLEPSIFGCAQDYIPILNEDNTIQCVQRPVINIEVERSADEFAI